MRLRPDHPRVHHLLQTSRAVFRLQTRPHRPGPRARLTRAPAPHRPGTLAVPGTVVRSRTLTRIVVVDEVWSGPLPVHRVAGVHACGVVPGEVLRLLHTGPQRALVEGMDDFVLCDDTLLALDFDGFDFEGLAVEVLTSPALVAAARRDADRLRAEATPYATYLARSPALCP
ncbi:DUF6879 family protein [Nocardiopsis alborubida]|uniref:DUF6879 domain-containing protein n=1 Tax=Nocardiopsis alborubida TaxID=146802 RepID=A0A7X6RNK3_9ACTN|nr:DUF6879 family protein [Nocardiopsis alborubida]NKY96623.1 hypothetical protein [Nocardiopsis alborubida]